MKKRGAFIGLFLLVIGIGAGFRLTRLDLRPMHHDEANQAVKFGDLLEQGAYRYDPTEHHGPTLYYATLPLAWLRGKATLASLDEVTLRLVPAVFGLAGLGLFLGLRRGLPDTAVVLSAVLAGVSPAMVFFSRFYIQEMLFVCFFVGVMAAVWRYALRPSWAWAAAAGFFCGLMWATKESCILVFAALILGLALSGIGKRPFFPFRPRWGHVAVFLAAGAGVAVLLFSSFFQNPGGIPDAFRAYGTYLERAGQPGLHAHPWFYYLKMLAFSRYGPGPVWSEALVLILALVGFGAALRPGKKEASSLLFARFVAITTLILTVLYSAVPYKTPWNLLPFYAGMILMAGLGAEALITISNRRAARVLVAVVLSGGIVHLSVESYRASFRDYANPKNPYVYAQTVPDFLNLVERVQHVASVHPEKSEILIKVITHPDEAWPLPWYLRRFGRVGYWTDAKAAGNLSDVPLLITSVDIASRLEALLELSHVREHYGLRPEVLLVLHIRKDLWERFLEHGH